MTTRLPLLFLWLPLFAFAADYYQINAGATVTIDEHGICREVTNNTGSALFVPTKTSAEWSSFYNTTTPSVTKGHCPVTVNYISSAGSNANSITYTFPAQSLGSPSADRYIVVGVGARAGSQQTIESVTVAGLATTELFEGGANGSSVGFYIVALPSGTSGDVVVTFGATVLRAGIGIWALRNLQSTTPYDTHQDTTPELFTRLTATIDAAAGGAVLAIVHSFETSSVTWTSITEDFDFVISDNNNGNISGASKTFTSAVNGTTFSVNASPSYSALAVVSLR